MFVYPLFYVGAIQGTVIFLLVTWEKGRSFKWKITR